MGHPLLSISNLSVTVQEKAVINNLSLTIAPGKIHAIMGPNGSGKSSLAYALMGHPAYQITSGLATFGDQDLLGLPVDRRAQAGLFLAFQYPQALPGVTVFSFLREAYTACSGTQIEIAQFEQLLKEALDAVGLDHSFAYRYLNDGFSGGEKKRLELVQMIVLQPKLAILDEIDSGLDIDALKLVAQAIANAQRRDPQISFIIITHYRRILDHVRPDHVHVMCDGNLVHSGDHELVMQLEQEGYHGFSQKAA